MSKIGVNFRIDVSKLDKARLFQGEKGTYADLTCFIELEQEDQFGNNGFISQQTTKEEREQGTKLPILGNVKIFWKDQAQPVQARPTAQKIAESFGGQVVGNPQDDNLPF